MEKREDLLALIDEISDPSLKCLAGQMMKESDALIADFADKKHKVDWFESEEELQTFVDNHKTV